MPTENPTTPTLQPAIRPHVRISEYSLRTIPQRAEAALSFWRDIHPRVARQARESYEDGDFIRAIKRALKSVHAVVQDRVRNCSGIDLDGETLMNRTFTPGGPIIELDDLSTKAGQDSQHGFMQLFAGSMTGFANPLCGGNNAPNDRQARHVIYLASLLMHKLDEGPAPDQS